MKALIVEIGGMLAQRLLHQQGGVVPHEIFFLSIQEIEPFESAFLYGFLQFRLCFLRHQTSLLI